MASTETRPSFRLPWSAGTGESDEHDAEETQVPEMTEMTDTVTSAAAPVDARKADVVPARRATKFMAELSLAMQAAAEHARSETMARFEVDAKAIVEEIRASATSEVAALRRQADDDVAAIRDRSKAEIARIREETEVRVAGRKTGLDAEMEAHAATVEARAQRVTVLVAAFEAEMTAFFERLNAEEDPSRIATMAETMPDPPSLEDVVASVAAASATASPAPDELPEPAAEAGPLADSEIDFAAAEAEAASFGGDLSALGSEDQDDTPVGLSDESTGDARAEAIAQLDAAVTTPDNRTTMSVVVTGLVSVASIANFKRSLSRIAGVWSIGVASGPDGEFIFSVSCDAGLQLSTAIVSMPGFESQISGESDGEIQVSAQDRDEAA
jgi:hypothetical protein